MKARTLLGGVAILIVGAAIAWQYGSAELMAMLQKAEGGGKPAANAPMPAGAAPKTGPANPAPTAQPQRPTRPPTPVGVAKAERKDIPISIRTIGTIQPFQSVLVKSRVDGTLAKVLVQEGQMVKEGDPLFTIDRRSFEAQLKQAQANLERDRAQLENARLDLARTERTVQQGALSQKVLDQARANAGALEGAVKSDEAAIDAAKVSLSYTDITSPIHGRAGDVRVTEGNLVKGNDASPLLVINQLRPIYVAFTVPEKYLPEIRARHNKAPLTASVIDNRGVTHPETGKLVFIDNNIDTNTGTIALKVEFTNDKDLLWPGQFVQVVLNVTTRQQVVVVPTQAVQTGQRGPYVYIAKGNIAEYRAIKTGPTVAEETIIEEGIEAGEQVIVDGHLRLGPNAPIVIRTLGRPPGAAPPGGGGGATPEKRS